ncbi:hypothetical protein OXX79_009855 [Metschnikowia pulcherrima]
MGIADLWPILPSDERVSFPVFLANFIQEHKRPPRLAIDAYMFIFWSSVSNADTNDVEKESWDIRNFMAKLWYLVSMNVSFVVVFDGKYKPGKLRHGYIPELPESCSYDEILRFYRGISSSDYSEGSRLVEKLKTILLRNRMSYVQCPAEAEAECAWLQRLGVVDYVVSDDSDTMVFGATRVLRWFNRIKKHREGEEPVKSSTDYYVTPVRISHVTKETYLNRHSLVMIAVLSGGDYSTGVENIGITRAKELALCGAPTSANLPRKTQQEFSSFPNLTSMFVKTFLDLEKCNILSTDPYFGIKHEYDRLESLKAFNAYFNNFLIERGSEVFGRKTSFKNSVNIDDYYAMLYFYPLVSRRIFKFSSLSTSFGEPKSVIDDLPFVNTNCRVPRINLIVAHGVIGESVVKEGSKTGFRPYLEIDTDKLPLPRERKHSLASFVLKFLRDKSFWRYIQFARTKEFEGIQMAVLKFNRVQLNEFVYYTKKDAFSEIDEPDEPDKQETEPYSVNDDVDSINSEIIEDEDKLTQLVLPLDCLKYVSSEFVNAPRPQPSRRSPSKKRAPPQKTTLDTLLGASKLEADLRAQAGTCSTLAPKTDTVSGLNAEMEVPEGRETVGWTSRHSSPRSKTLKTGMSISAKGVAKKPFRRRKGQKPELPSGQSTLTTFLQSKRVGGSAVEPLFVLSEDEAEDGDVFYRGMKDAFGFGPKLNLPDPPKIEVNQSLNVQDGSPTKKLRKEMAFSPDTSPVKARPETKCPW